MATLNSTIVHVLYVLILVPAEVMYTFSFNNVVRGYHEYKDIWDAEVDGISLPCEREPGKPHDMYRCCYHMKAIRIWKHDHWTHSMCNIYDMLYFLCVEGNELDRKYTPM